MEFRRVRKRGQRQSATRTWLSDDHYRILWRREVCGVRVPARFQATVKVLVPHSGGELRLMWDFCNRNRRLTKTLKAAIEECERHKRLWERACEAGSVRALRELFGGKLPTGLPLWARKKMDRRLYAILTDNRPSLKYRDDEEDELCTESSQPASDAPGPGGPFCSAPTEATSEAATPASPAEGKGRKKRASEHTRESSKQGAARPSQARQGAARLGEAGPRKAWQSKDLQMSTTASSASGAKRSKGSRKTKSKL